MDKYHEFAADFIEHPEQFGSELESSTEYYNSIIKATQYLK